MMTNELKQTIKDMVVIGKGILAADESVSTATKRLASINVESTEETRRQYRNLILTAPGIERYLCGVILFEETLKQKTDSGVLFPKHLSSIGVVPGIKVDRGLADFNGVAEQYTKELEGLGDRLEEYKKSGCRFAKWRAVYSISEKTPGPAIIQRNAEDLAKYAKICQEHGIVPIVEPEVLMNGSHTIEQCYDVTVRVLMDVFLELKKENVDLSGMLLKPNMVIGSLEGPETTSGQIAESTLKCLSSVVPTEVPGIVFLSGGQSEEEACENLNAINQLAKNVPWKLTFSYGRALQNSALQTWAGKKENVVRAQKVFVERAKAASLASQGKMI